MTGGRRPDDGGGPRDRRRRRSPVSAAVGLVVGLAATGLGASAVPVGAVVDSPDVDTAAAYRYVVDPKAGEVEVTINLTFTADKPNRTTSSGYVQYYFDGTGLIIPADVEDLTVTDAAGRDLSYEIDDTVDDIGQLIIDFRRSVFYRQSTDVIVRFTLNGGEARGDEATRVNDAYAGFEAWVDPWLEAATVTVVVPDGFVDRSTGSELFDLPEVVPADEADGGGDRLVFEAADVDPELYWAAVSLTRDDELVTTELDIDGVAVDVLAWPGDEPWSRFVVDNLEEGLPILIDEVGLEWPLDNDLTIIESYTPYLHGYAGWYDLITDEIEIGDELDTHVMFHELSHVWFNGQLFGERWITEGLADEFGAHVAEAVGEQRPAPPATLRGHGAAEPLNDWQQLTDDVELEQWAYGASWTVTRAIADEVGIEVLAGAIQAAAADEIPYVGDGEPETEVRRNDWRLYLDLLENGGQVTDDTITDLFTAWVLGPADARSLGPRSVSRQAYTALAEQGDGWAPPLVVRSAMSAWTFDEADELMVDASAILADRDAAIDAIGRLERSLGEGSAATLPSELEAAYESAEDDLEGPAGLAADAARAAGALAATGVAVDEADGLLERLGAIGADHRGDLARAATAFSAGDLATARTEAAAIGERVDGLGGRGLVRLIVALVVLVALAVAAVVAVRRTRPSERPSSTPPGPPPEIVAPRPLAQLPAGPPPPSSIGPD